MTISSNVILTEDHLTEVVSRFLEHDAFVFDVETIGEYRGVPTQNVVSWLSMATDGECVVIPMGHPNGSKLITPATKKLDKVTRKFDIIDAVYDEPPEQMMLSQAFKILEPLFFSGMTKVAHNATFDLISVTKHFGGRIPPGPYSDTIVLQWLLDENLKKFGLKDLVKTYYGHDYDNEHVGRRVEAHPFNKVARYAYLDAKYTWLLFNMLDNQIVKEGLEPIRDLEEEVLDVLLRMGTTGAPVDVESLRDLEVVLADSLVDIEARVYKAAGQEFNINSTPQRQAILFGAKDAGGQGLRPRKLTPTGAPSTGAEVLEYYPKNLLAATLLEYAEVAKLQSTYVQGYLGVEGNAKKPCRIFKGRVYTDLVQYGTTTGRFSSREPNLQNIPRPGTDLGKKVRSLFIPPAGEKLIVADYGQIELVILAHYAGKGALFKGFHTGVDPHTMTAALVLGKDPSEVTPDERQWYGKSINFAVVYGAGPDKVAAMANTNVTTAKKLLATHEKQFPEIYRFKDSVLAKCKSRRPPYVQTLLGRKRRLPGINYSDFSQRGYAERQAVNSLIQGSAADIIKLAMVRLDATLPDSMHLILSVHDELVVTCPQDEIEMGKNIVHEAMLGQKMQDLLKVPLASDIKVVDNWGQAK
jgi:DNA polymerase I-like protein with 3'-5' exonuclease and polymerase domains